MNLDPTQFIGGASTNVEKTILMCRYFKIPSDIRKQTSVKVDHVRYINRRIIHFAIEGGQYTKDLSGIRRPELCSLIWGYYNALDTVINFSISSI